MIRARAPAACATVALLAAALAASPAAEPGKQLARVAGTVQYQLGERAPYHLIFGEIELPDDAVAVTLAASQAELRLADSSQIDIGARTRVRVGAFDAAGTGAANVVTLTVGALHFVVRHPAGARANYLFVTPTSQIAVRGTDGYLITGPTGTDFYCEDCSPGDVTMTVGTRSYALATGQQAIVTGKTAAGAGVSIVKEPCTNPVAVELSGGKLGAGVPRDRQIDTTGALDADPLQVAPSPAPRADPTPPYMSPGY